MPSGEVALPVLAWLGTYAVHSTLFLGAAWALSRWRLVRSPRLAEKTWRLALFGGVLTASLQLAIGAEPVLGRVFLDTADAVAWVDADAAPATSAEGALDPGFAPPPAPLRETRSSSAARPVPPAEPAPLDGATTRDAAPSLPAAARRAGRARRAEAREESMAPDASRVSRVRSTLHGDPPALPGATSPTRPGATSPARPSVTSIEAPFASPDPAPAAAAQPPARPSALASALASGLARLRATSLRHALLVVWSLVVALGLVGILGAWTRLFARLSDRREIVRGPLREALDRLLERAQVRGRVRLTASPTLDSPVTCGWVRREICIPTRAITELSPSQQESMLAHELAHAKGRDPLWFTLYALLERAFFFQPLNRAARRELHQLAELRCDDHAVRWTGRRLALASCLTEVAQWIVGRRELALTAGMAEQPSRLGQRVERLLDDRRSPTPEPRHAWWSPAAVGALGLFVFAVPGVASARPLAPLADRERTPADVDEAKSAAVDDGLEDASPLGLLLMVELMENDLALTEQDLASVRAELAEAELDGSPLLERYEGLLRDFERRLESLREKRALLKALVRRHAAASQEHGDRNS